MNILRTAPFKAANFYAFDLYRKAFLRKTGQRDLTNWERIMAGAAAGATATVVCFPLDTVSGLRKYPSERLRSPSFVSFDKFRLISCSEVRVVD